MTSAEVAHSKRGKPLPVESLNFQPLACSVAKCFSQDCHNCLVFINLLTSQRIGRIFEAFIVLTSMWVVYYDALSCIQSAHMSHHSDRRHCHIAWPSSSLLSSRLNRRNGCFISREKQPKRIKKHTNAKVSTTFNLIYCLAVGLLRASSILWKPYKNIIYVMFIQGGLKILDQHTTDIQTGITLRSSRILLQKLSYIPSIENIF